MSRASGVSRTSIYRALEDGRLLQYVVGDGARKLLHPSAVDFLRGGVIRQRRDSPWVDRPVAAEEEPAAAPLEVVSCWANALLADGWSPPPWPAERWLTLLGVWDEAEGLALVHGPLTPEAFRAAETDACEGIESPEAE